MFSVCRFHNDFLQEACRIDRRHCKKTTLQNTVTNTPRMKRTEIRPDGECDETYQPTPFYYRDIVQTIFSLLLRPEAKDMSTTYEEKQNESGERVYSGFATGDYVKETEASKGHEGGPPADATILYANTWIDATLLGNFGKAHAKPLCITLGNFQKKKITTDGAKSVMLLTLKVI